MRDPSTILVSGWRFIPHSYAVVNQFQCLELLSRPEVRLLFEDRPYYQSSWKPAAGLFDAERERAIREIPSPPPGVCPDAELRIVYPYDLLTPPRCARTFVFGTAEYRVVPAAFVAGGVPVADAIARMPGATIITPSNWSREGFLASGVPAERVSVVPHGVDPSIFGPPTPEQRLAARGRLGRIGVHEDDFIFLNLGAMTGNKGMKILLPAFARVLEKHPRCRLVLKGLDELYMSKNWLNQDAVGIHPDALRRVLPRLSYIGQQLSYTDVASLYHLADCYVAPYLAEGFNLPALEAAACGLPVICTAGGPTDDFATDDFALRIPSTPAPVQRQPGEAQGQALVPDFEGLVRLMTESVERPEFRRAAREAGPAHVGGHFTWRHVVDRLLAIMLASP